MKSGTTFPTYNFVISLDSFLCFFFFKLEVFNYYYYFFCAFSLHDTSESEPELGVVPEEEAESEQDAEQEQPAEPSEKLVKVIVPQDDYQSSMTEYIKLVQNDKNFIKLSVRMFVIVQFLAKKMRGTFCCKKSSLLWT